MLCNVITSIKFKKADQLFQNQFSWDPAPAPLRHCAPTPFSWKRWECGKVERQRKETGKRARLKQIHKHKLLQHQRNPEWAVACGAEEVG